MSNILNKLLSLDYFKFGYFIFFLYILFFGFLVFSNLFSVKASYEVIYTQPSNLSKDEFESLSSVISLICYSICFLICSIPNIILAIWIYFDGKKWKVDNPFLWAFLSLISFPIFAIIYFLVIRKEAKEKFEKRLNYDGNNNNNNNNY